MNPNWLAPPLLPVGDARAYGGSGKWAHQTPNWPSYGDGLPRVVAKTCREQLILCYVPLVKRVVGRLGLSAFPTLDHQDLVSHGIAGLIEAFDRFDPSRGVSFETFASQRIRGAVLDTLRLLDTVPRSVRQRAAQIEHAIHQLRTMDNAWPTDDEIAEHLGWSLATYHEVMDQAQIAFLSLDSPFLDLQRGDESLLLGEALEDPTVQDVSEEIEERDLRRELAEAIHDLPEREQMVLSLYYYEELTIREVGAVLNLSPSRVSQLLSRAIMTLRASLIYQVKGPAARSNLSKLRASPLVRQPLYGV